MTEQNKLLVQRLIEEAFNPGNPDVLDEVAKGEFAVTARRWIGPDGTPSPTSGWRAPTWVADGEKLAAYSGVLSMNRAFAARLCSIRGYAPGLEQCRLDGRLIR